MRRISDGPLPKSNEFDATMSTQWFSSRANQPTGQPHVSFQIFTCAASVGEAFGWRRGNLSVTHGYALTLSYLCLHAAMCRSFAAPPRSGPACGNLDLGSCFDCDLGAPHFSSDLAASSHLRGLEPPRPRAELRPRAGHGLVPLLLPLSFKVLVEDA